MGLGQDSGDLSRACLSEVPNSQRDEWRLLTSVHAGYSCLAGAPFRFWTASPGQNLTGTARQSRWRGTLQASSLGRRGEF